MYDMFPVLTQAMQDEFRGFSSSSGEIPEPKR